MRRWVRGTSGRLRFRLQSALIAVAVICAGLAILVPWFRHARQAKRWMECNKNLKQIGLALQNYEDVFGSLPPAYLTDQTGVPLLSWRVLILPFLGYDSLYNQIKLDEPWNSAHNGRLSALMPGTYRCPADANANIGETSYVAVSGPETSWPGAKSRRRSTSDMKTEVSVILLVEVVDLGISWMEPRDLHIEATDNAASATMSSIAFRHPCGGGDEPIAGVYSGYRPNAVGYRLYGANCLFADGIVLAVSADVSPRRMKELLTVEKNSASGIGLNTEAGTDVTKTLAPAALGEAAKKAAEKNR